MTTKDRIALKAEFFELCQNILTKEANHADIERITRAMCDAGMHRMVAEEFKNIHEILGV